MQTRFTTKRNEVCVLQASPWWSHRRNATAKTECIKFSLAASLSICIVCVCVVYKYFYLGGNNNENRGTPSIKHLARFNVIGSSYNVYDLKSVLNNIPMMLNIKQNPQWLSKFETIFHYLCVEQNTHTRAHGHNNTMKCICIIMTSFPGTWHMTNTTKLMLIWVLKSILSLCISLYLIIIWDFGIFFRNGYCLRLRRKRWTFGLLFSTIFGQTPSRLSTTSSLLIISLAVILHFIMWHWFSRFELVLLLLLLLHCSLSSLCFKSLSFAQYLIPFYRYTPKDWKLYNEATSWFLCTYAHDCNLVIYSRSLRDQKLQNQNPKGWTQLNWKI